jgi:hypothetical protein
VADAAGQLLEVLATFSSADKGAPGAYSKKGGYDLAAYAGQPIHLRFRATKTYARTTTFRIDDVGIR